ncbi:hypothetical protein F7725_009172 [Dissostichus mawsoni]|uniref:Uncharacterized protein n=1 Tax=Dissostichus mawsoni TaxID=36200 RepID=A0A7J5Z718_DISMA|nr:hypothetical protein F7725_009172 [Dissostichus mawsoni]
MLVYGTWRYPRVPNPSQSSERVPLSTDRFMMKCLFSLLHSGREVGAPCLDDLRPQGAGFVVLVTVVGGGAVASLVIADVDDDTGGGGVASVLWSRSLASAAARASLKLILTLRKDLKYWNCTSGSKERNKASKLPCRHREGERVHQRSSDHAGTPDAGCSLTCASGRLNTSSLLTEATRQKRLHLVVLMCMMGDPGRRNLLHLIPEVRAQRDADTIFRRCEGGSGGDEEEGGNRGERRSVAFPRVAEEKEGIDVL